MLRLGGCGPRVCGAGGACGAGGGCGGGGGDARGARWALGALLLAPLAAAGAGYVTVPAIFVLALAMLFAVFTCSDLRRVGALVPARRTARGRRARTLRSLGDFLATWLRFLAHLAAVAVCARVLSATADHVSAGRVRRWLFGYEARALGEPWPDVLGVTVVLVVCAMFMCGLEESAMFTCLLLALLYVFSQLFAIFGLARFQLANLQMPTGISAYEIFAAGAPVAYAFSAMAAPLRTAAGGGGFGCSGGGAGGGDKRHALLGVGIPLLVLSGLCFLYSNILNGHSVDAALPVTTLLEALAAGWMGPLLAAVTVAGMCLALTELCPALFTVLVELASPEWKVLTRSMTYESATTGSPVLAVFTAGSLAAILAFACPLAHMITLLNASHLLGIIIQALQLTVMRCVPTDEQEEQGDVEYKRLDTGPSSSRAKTVRTKSGLWFLPQRLRNSKTLENLKAKVTKECEERECLLLDEYGGGGEAGGEGEGGAGAVGADEASDVDVASDATSGDDSTDIDAVVKEYRDTVKVVTATPESPGGVVQVAGRRGAWLAAGGAAAALAGAVLAAAALCSHTAGGPMLTAAIPVWALGTLVAAAQPAHKLESWCLQRVEGPVCLLLSVLFLTPLLLDSWPAILLFAGAGVVIYARCERWCGDLAIQRVRRAPDRRKLHPAAATSSATVAHLDTLYISR